MQEGDRSHASSIEFQSSPVFNSGVGLPYPLSVLMYGSFLLQWGDNRPIVWNPKYANCSSPWLQIITEHLWNKRPEKNTSGRRQAYHNAISFTKIPTITLPMIQCLRHKNPALNLLHHDTTLIMHVLNSVFVSCVFCLTKMSAGQPECCLMF